MAEAGLTRGGFYHHFKNKDDLLAAVVRAEFADTPPGSGVVPPDAIAMISENYLAAEHRDDVAGGCFMCAMAAELSRADTASRDAFTEMAQGFVEMAASAIPEDDPKRRRKALAILAQSVGSVIMARAVADEEMSDAILAAGREALAKLA